MKTNQKTFGLLLLAYLISMLYQYYRYILHQHPADTFGATEIIGYLVLISWSSLALINRKWAVWAIIILCTVQLGIGFLYYFPSIFRYRHDNFWDWAEAISFVLLIALAGFRSVNQLARFKKAFSYG